MNVSSPPIFRMAGDSRNGFKFQMFVEYCINMWQFDVFVLHSAGNFNWSPEPLDKSSKLIRCRRHRAALWDVFAAPPDRGQYSRCLCRRCFLMGHGDCEGFRAMLMKRKYLTWISYSDIAINKRSSAAATKDAETRRVQNAVKACTGSIIWVQLLTFTIDRCASISVLKAENVDWHKAYINYDCSVFAFVIEWISWMIWKKVRPVIQSHDVKHASYFRLTTAGHWWWSRTEAPPFSWWQTQTSRLVATPVRQHGV